MLLLKCTARVLRGHQSNGSKLFEKLQSSRKSSSSLTVNEPLKDNGQCKMLVAVDPAKVQTAVCNMPPRGKKLIPKVRDTILPNAVQQSDPVSERQCSSVVDEDVCEPVVHTHNGMDTASSSSPENSRNPIEILSFSKSEFFQVPENAVNAQLEPELEDESVRIEATNMYANQGEVLARETIGDLPKSKQKLKLRNLGAKAKAAEKLMPNVPPGKGKLRAVVDIEMMKRELKQLEDPPRTPMEKHLSADRLNFQFFDVPCETLAQNLLGKILVRQLENGTILKGRIVETESYLGGEDKASHSYQNKVTARNIPMYMPPGTIYVYITYGMYHCFNISCKGDGSAVLLRAVEPIEGMKDMADFRNSKTNSKKPKKSLKNFKVHELTNGPSKLCLAFSLNRDNNKYSLCTCKGMWIENDVEKQNIEIVQCPRIGIDSAGPEWAQKPLRFYVYGNKCVSKRDKKAEEALGAEHNIDTSKIVPLIEENI